MVTSYQSKLQEPKPQPYPNVDSFMSRSFVRVSPDTDIYTAMAMLLKHQVSGAPVVDGEDRLLGFISEKDCLSLVAHDSYDHMQHGGPVTKFMTAQVLTLTPEMGLNEVAEIFMSKPYRKLPVVDGGKLVGVVRRRDALGVVQKFYKERAKALKN